MAPKAKSIIAKIAPADKPRLARLGQSHELCKVNLQVVGSVVEVERFLITFATNPMLCIMHSETRRVTLCARMNRQPLVPVVQIEVVGVNWQARQLLLGECKWGEQTIGKQTVRELLEKRGPRVIGKMGIAENLWQIIYLLQKLKAQKSLPSNGR